MAALTAVSGDTTGGMCKTVTCRFGCFLSSVRRLQCDEIWCFVGAKAKNVTPEKKAEGWGDTWTWTGLDADTKLCVSYLVGGRSADWAMEFMLDCANRIKGRVQVTTDGHKAYLEAVETAFGRGY